MKKIFLSAVLTLMLLLVPVSGTALAGIDATENYSLEAGDGFKYTESTFTDGGNKQAMFYGEYKPSQTSQYEFVIHSIRNGNKTTVTNVLDIAKDYEKSTGRKVILATNGDYFDLANGNNMDSYVNDGIVISKGPHAAKHCMGFDNNGKIVVGRLTEAQKRLLVEIDGEKRLFNIDKVNSEPADGEIAIYNTQGTYTVKGAGKYVIYTDSVNLGQYPVWGESHRMTEGTPINDDSFTLRSGQFAIVVKGDENAQYFFDNVVYGVKCSLVEVPDGDFKDCNWVIGGYDILVDNGEVNTNPHTDNYGSTNAPRTFMGFKEDGTGFLCVIDGRQPAYSAGVTVKREAEIAKELGAKFALELDGGGSSTVILRVNDELTLRNKPSDMDNLGNNVMRKVSNAVLLVEKTAAGGEGTGGNPQPPDTPSTETPSTPGNTGTAGGGANNDNNVIIIVISACVGGVLLVAAIAVAVKIIKKRSKNEKDL